MSKIIENCSDRENACFVEADDGHIYYVDADNTFDAGWELMAFKCFGKDAEGNYRVDWSGVYRYNSNRTAVLDKYEEVRINIENYIREEEDE